MREEISFEEETERERVYKIPAEGERERERERERGLVLWTVKLFAGMVFCLS